MSSFKIIAELQHEDIVRASSIRPVAFRICTEVDGTTFPARDWFDFGVVMLGWWAGEINALEDARQTTAILRFMEGPYELRIVARTHNRWSLSAHERGSASATVLQSELSRKDVVEEIRRSSSELLDLCKRYNYWTDDCETLSVAIAEQTAKDVRAV